jgi:hypothetical protein
MEFGAIEEFKKDLKKLSKRFITLSDDLEILKRVLTVSPGERPPFSYRIDGLGINTCIIKIRKIACKSLKGRGAESGLRIVYAHFKTEEKIIFIELYFKGDKENEDRERIQRNFK